jgi:hypothetical protein
MCNVKCTAPSSEKYKKKQHACSSIGPASDLLEYVLSIRTSLKHVK